MDKEHKEELRIEALNEARDVSFHAWRNENMDDLKSDFLSDNDDFETFCREEYRKTL